MRRLGRITVGGALTGAGYQCVKKVIISDSVVGSSFYSGLATLCFAGAYRCLDDIVLVQRVQQLLGNEDSETAQRIAPMLTERIPDLEKRILPGQHDAYQLQEPRSQTGVDPKWDPGNGKAPDIEYGVYPQDLSHVKPHIPKAKRQEHPTQEDVHQLQELKRQIMKERGYL
ncbi:MAG: hypothetical protein KKC75_08375 [Nanoarchaeota archaeon]|nr:hypothetical protein [Nanoarchaeota archaeon]MBU1004487.1 hypothetical protein [Nanoarchaeota archaeon]MBU1945657.1 hypothetical protein [Nanoarchaeota archaeon]